MAETTTTTKTVRGSFWNDGDGNQDAEFELARAMHLNTIEMRHEAQLAATAERVAEAASSAILSGASRDALVAAVLGALKPVETGRRPDLMGGFVARP